MNNGNESYKLSGPWVKYMHDVGGIWTHANEDNGLNVAP